MKVNGNDGSDNNLRKIQESSLKDTSNTGAAANQAGKAAAGTGQPASGAEDKVRISGLVSAINQELNPASMAAERADRVANLKKLILEGKYNPKSEDVARALSQELSMEILTAPDSDEGEGIL